MHSVISLQDGPFVARLRERGHDVLVIETGRRLSMLQGAARMRRALRADPPRVLHANGVKAALVSALATPATGIPVVWVKHDFYWDGWLAALIGWRSHEVVAVSEAVTRTFGRRRARVRVVHNGIPPIDRDRESSRRLVRELVGGDHPVVLVVGRFHPAKGQIELVEAAPRVLERLPDTRFLLLGDEDQYRADYRSGVQRRILELGLGETVLLHRHHPDAPAVMAGADLVAVPSVPDESGMGREGFGLVGVEAMAVGTPVVGYDGGALPEVLGECAVLVPERDRTALADAIVAVLDDAGRRERLARCGRALIAERYAIDATVAAMSARYAEAASRS